MDLNEMRMQYIKKFGLRAIVIGTTCGFMIGMLRQAEDSPEGQTLAVKALALLGGGFVAIQTKFLFRFVQLKMSLIPENNHSDRIFTGTVMLVNGGQMFLFGLAIGSAFFTHKK